MRWVEAAAIRPNRCAVLPFIGNSNARKGFIDTGAELDGFDNHVYVSVEAAEEMARMLGWQSPQAVRDLQRELAAAGELIGELQARALEMEQAFGAIDVIESAGFRARKKPGRKPREEVAA